MTKKKDTANKVHSFWWQEDEEQAYQAVYDRAEDIEEAQKAIHELHLRHASLYGNCEFAGFGFKTGSRDYSKRIFEQAVTENVIGSVCDTATALVAKNKPRVVLSTDGGDFSEQRLAKKLERATEGMFDRADLYEKGVLMFRDATVFGDGFLKISELDDEVHVERVLVDEILVDEVACRGSGPREMIQRKFVDREVLKAYYPEHEEAIENANRERRTWTSWRKVDSNQCVVIEAWHLPSSPTAGDGRWAVVIENATLVWEPYNEIDFPIVRYSWSPPLCGYYGQGLAEQLTGIQATINKVNRFIREAQDLIAVPRIFVNTTSRTLVPQITNKIGAIIKYTGQRPPTFHTPTAVGPEIYAYKEQLKQAAYEFAGISTLSAQSKQPKGLESAVALRTYNDIETQRFAIQAQRYEKLFITIARKMIDVATTIYKRKKKFTTVFAGRNVMEKIDWTKIGDLDKDRYSMAVEAASILSRTPAGRIQEVIELSQAGLIRPEQAQRLLGHADIERERSLANAAVEDIEATIEQLLEGKHDDPEPFQNLQMGITRVQAAYLKARREGAPDEILENMRGWMENAQHLLAPPQPQAGMPGAPAVEGAALPPGVMPGAPGEGVLDPAFNTATPAPALAQESQFLRPSAARSI